MTINDKKEFAELVNQLFRLYLRKAKKDDYISYWDVLKDFDFSEVKEAFNKALDKEPKYIPAPALVLSCIKGDKDIQAVEAWNLVRNSLKKYGMYDKPKFDEVIEKAIEYIGGWVQLCKTTDKQLDYVKRSFLDGFKHYVGTVQKYEMLPVQNETKQIGTKIDPRDTYKNMSPEGRARVNKIIEDAKLKFEGKNNERS